MKSLLLAVVARGIVPVASLFAVYLLLRGHNAPGGGFVAGLVVAAAFFLQILAFGLPADHDRLRSRLQLLMWLGLMLALISGLLACFVGLPFLTHFHGGDLSTTLLFDLGVFGTVVGAAALMLMTLAEEQP